MIQSIIQSPENRILKIKEASLMLKSPEARVAFVQLANEFPEFVVGSHCGMYRKSSAFLIDWVHNITLTVEDKGEWERI